MHGAGIILIAHMRTPIYMQNVAVPFLFFSFFVLASWSKVVSLFAAFVNLARPRSAQITIKSKMLCV